MANLTRSAKSASECADNELLAYNITVTPPNVAAFFGIPTLPQPSSRRVILEEYPPGGIADKVDRQFFFYLEEAMVIAHGEESAVNDFTAHLLTLLGYGVADHFVRTRVNILLLVCGGITQAQTDLCLVDRKHEILLVMQEDKSHLAGMDPEPQLIAEAIAAYQYNNMWLKRIALPTIQAKMIPGIVMVGSTPTFYKIPITQDLVFAVQTGQYPEKPTIVHKLIPPLADLNQLFQDGMRPLNNRDIIIRCFEAFKRFV